MASTVTPSEDTITAGQIGKISELLAAALRKSGLLSGPVQLIIESDGASLVDELVTSVRKRVEAISNLISRRWTADRSRSAGDTLIATGRKLYVTDTVVAAMPRGEGEEGETFFFKLDLSERDGYISDDDLEAEFALRGLVPECPDTLAAINEADPTFADDHPNATHWKDVDGKWCYAAFRRWSGERRVLVHRVDSEWDGRWWFAGRRK